MPDVCCCVVGSRALGVPLDAKDTDLAAAGPRSRDAFFLAAAQACKAQGLACEVTGATGIWNRKSHVRGPKQGGGTRAVKTYACSRNSVV